MFLTRDELKMLTGYAHKARQVAELRRMGITFWVNAAGQPIVARSTFDGGRQPAQQKQWEPLWGANLAKT